MSRRLPPSAVTLAALIAVALASTPAVAQDASTELPRDVSAIDPAPFIIDIDATVLDITATILDIDAGTGTTETTEETTITLEADVFFDFDEHRLRRDARDTLAEVAETIRTDGATGLRIDGHTDAIGTDSYNQRLSERRAGAVEAFLAGHLEGVDMTTEGFGASRPVAPNETGDGEDNPEGRALNRRVEITYPR